MSVARGLEKRAKTLWHLQKARNLNSQAGRRSITFLTMGGMYHTLQTMAQLVMIRSR